MTIKTIEYAQDEGVAELSFGPYSVMPTTRYISTRAAGRLRKYRFEQQEAGAAFVMGNWKEAAAQLGGR